MIPRALKTASAAESVFGAHRVPCLGEKRVATRLFPNDRSFDEYLFIFMAKVNFGGGGENKS
jgi:hypothetical protein